MIVLLPAVLALSLGAAAELRAVRLTTLDFRPALRVLTSEDVRAATAVREGEEVVLIVPARAVEGLVLPALEAPLEAIRLVSEAERTLLRIKVAPEVPFETTHEPGMTTIVFGEQPVPELRGPVTPALYARLFPAGVQGPPAAEDAVATAPNPRHEGLVLGRVSLRPYLNASWVDASVALASPTPAHDRYLQLAPSLAAFSPLLDGQLSLEYEPRLRFFSSLPQLGATSHFVGATLELPFGSRAFIEVADHLTRALLETNVVDPGREYFFDLAPFVVNDASASLRVELGPRLSAQLGGGLKQARFDAGSSPGFFDYAARTFRAGMGYDLGAELRALVNYSFDRVPPPPERALAETSAHSLTANLSGPIGPLMTGTLTAGYRQQANPRASGESRSYRGLVLGGSLRRDLGHSSSLDLQFNRAVTLSAFETNAYYVANSVTLALSVPVPLQTAARGSLTWMRNDYPNAVDEIGVPRRDRVLGWTAGLGRQIGSRAWLRVDYRREQRDSNLSRFEVTTDGFTVQLGVGVSGTARP